MCIFVHNSQSIKSINFPSSLVEISNNAFDDCFALANVTFEVHYSLRIIGIRAFNTCSNLSVFIIPSTVTSIGEDAFTEIDINMTLYYCGRRTFTGNIIGNSSNYKVIVPFGGPKRFGNLYTTYGESHCLMLEEKVTCRIPKQAYPFFRFIQVN